MNSPFDCRTRPNNWAADLSPDCSSVCRLNGIEDTVWMLPPRTTNNGASVQPRAIALATIAVLRAPLPISGATAVVILRIVGQWPPCREMVFVARWRCIVGSKEASCTIAVVQLPQTRSPGEDVVMGVIRVSAEPVARP